MYPVPLYPTMIHLPTSLLVSHLIILVSTRASGECVIAVIRFRESAEDEL